MLTEIVMKGLHTTNQSKQTNKQTNEQAQSLKEINSLWSAIKIGLLVNFDSCKFDVAEISSSDFLFFGNSYSNHLAGINFLCDV